MKKLCPTCEREKDTKEFYSNAAQKTSYLRAVRSVKKTLLRIIMRTTKNTRLLG